jgi:hypothetical protein
LIIGRGESEMSKKEILLQNFDAAFIYLLLLFVGIAEILEMILKNSMQEIFSPEQVMGLWGMKYMFNDTGHIII